MPLNNRPIVVMGLPRSGTSMVAGLFAKHGVFVGECKPANEKNAKGFFEHIGFTQLMIQRYGKGLISKGTSVEWMPQHPLSKGVSVEGMSGFKSLILNMMREEGYIRGLWLIKHATIYHKLWVEFDPYFILVRRDSESILRSVQACGWKAQKKTIQIGQDLLDSYVNRGVEVYSEKIIKGDYSQLKQAFEFCGLELNEDIVRDFVAPELWNYKSEEEDASIDTDTSVVMRDKEYLKPNVKRGQKNA